MKPLVTDELWTRIEPLLPAANLERQAYPARAPSLDYRFQGLQL
jgi:transposase